MLSKVHVTLLRQILSIYGLSMHIIYLNHEAFFISQKFNFVSSLNHFQLPPFKLNKVNVTLLIGKLKRLKNVFFTENLLLLLRVIVLR